VESWRLVWRNGFAPVLPTAGLELLEAALRNDDPRLIQGGTTTPPPFMCVEDWSAEAADAVAMCGVPDAGGWGHATVGQVEEFFAQMCFQADQRLGDPAACRWFLNWFDETPRDEMRRELLHEVERELKDRAMMVLGPPEEFEKAFWKTPHDPTLSGAISDWYGERGEELPAQRWKARMERLISGDFT
jgi:hypothetical protein